METTGPFNSTMLSLKNVSYAFSQEKGLKPIFTGLSMEIQDSEFVSIIGASGSGKSTLFKLITGLLAPTEGEIWINGKESKNRLGQVGYMPQKDMLLPWRTIIDNVLLPLELSKERNQEKVREVREWLDRFGLLEYECAYPQQLSGGMKQRIAFLRTIMTGQNILLLDEPFGALDALTKRDMHRWLLGLLGDLQKTVLFITHDLEEAILLSDRIYLLSSDPGKAAHEIINPLPRPRNSELIYEPLFIEMRKELERQIHDVS
jgi:putative hydroxymethylpyrimidine transport system ATP-binding protein